MKINGKHFRTIWPSEDNPNIICVIDQRLLPHQFVVEELKTLQDIITAIKEMQVRGAGLIGAAAGYGMLLGVLEAAKSHSFDSSIQQAAENLLASRPTAVNLFRAVQLQLDAMANESDIEEKIKIARLTANKIADEDALYCKTIGLHGVEILEAISRKKNGDTINILTHCNAGWLAFVDYGSATAPIYEAFNRGIKLHVWVDETRPRNQGASLTAWEFLNHGVPHTIIADNVGGHLMQHGMVDIVITGADRVTRTGDAANKIGTYLKALAAYDNNIPFYIALPSSTFDWTIKNGVQEIPIEERDENEVKYMQGLSEGAIKTILIAPKESPAKNYGFDVTPARLISGLITERGICAAHEQAILSLYPENKSQS
jgi:methylthioribose-1-phosphate isomerase